MATTHERIFGGELPSAGLSSSQQHQAYQRYSPTRVYVTYEPSKEHAIKPNEPRSQILRRQIEESTIATAFRETPGAHPSKRPILATSCTPTQMRTSRHTNPLSPVYPIPSDHTNGPPLQDSMSRSGTRPMSRSLDTSDIQGARPTHSTVSNRMHSSIDYSDVPGTRPHLPGQGRPTAVPTSLTTDGIQGATPARKARREVISPGRGTLHAADISGARPGTSRAAAEQLPSIWALGRYPMPSTPSYGFNLQARHTMIQRPGQFTVTEDNRHSGVRKMGVNR